MTDTVIIVVAVAMVFARAFVKNTSLRYIMNFIFVMLVFFYIYHTVMA